LEVTELSTAKNRVGVTLLAHLGERETERVVKTFDELGADGEHVAGSCS
jgi:hypothetical protein